MDIKLSIVKKVEQCFVQAEVYFECVLTRPKVSFNIRGQDAGRAYFPINRNINRSKISTKKNEIKFNEVLLEKNPDFFLKNIVPHECAHLIVYELFGTSALPHGKEWKGVMEKVFGVDSQVKHNLDVSDVTNKPYIYSCSCQGEGIALSKRQHNALEKGASYICRACKAELKFKFEKVNALKKTSHEIKGLYLYFEGVQSIDELVFQKIDTILGAKRPLVITTSLDLSKNQIFKTWLRSKSLVRKYKGEISPEEIEDKFQKQEISHAILVRKEKYFSGRDYWEALRLKGLLLRNVSSDN